MTFSNNLETSEEEVVPTMNDNIISRRPILPTVPHTKNGHANPTATLRPTQIKTGLGTVQTTTGRTTSTTSNAHNIIQAAHPQDNEIAGSVNIRYDQYDLIMKNQFIFKI